jgi:hypothetical protein
MIAADIGWRAITSIAKPRGFMRREGFGWKGITDSGENIYPESVNPPTKQGAAWEDSLRVPLRI